ncbi:enoyl-CoA hydratase/isomerase family protein [Streptomyces sp. NBC_00588]|uniref:enoyl-CoA hydratase/isomerase family protein n=1 Tax=Streptomyces sp. NBC_00588 TaxID=2975784 RepID=UPI002E809F22|nr:enoyl-CoA hydratase/isomerase family protein [Streptomyces sp. NBC_00588]WUB41317.1 enoyl-CoA hydratase/isomerase family protein [Streptomyces sp. NBC_00588]
MSQFTVTKPSASQWRVSFNNEPINLFGSQSILELRSIIEDAEQDENLNVILFESANPDYFIAHWDLTDDASALPTGPTGHGAFMDAMIRLSRLPVITVSSIRGRARGAGSEFLLATDIRFASRERARIGQFEMSGGVVPGGGGIGRLTRLVGRGRALEITAGALDFDGDLAERYGYVNRSLPDAELDTFVHAFVDRLAGFLPRAVRELKQLTDAITLPENDAFAPEADAFHNGLGQPETQGWAQRMFERGLQQPGVLEENLMEEAEPLPRRS